MNKKKLHKKRLRLKRKQFKKRIFVPRVVIDTSVWYLLGKDDDLFNREKSKLSPIYNNLWELSNTGRIINKAESVRKAIQKVMLCKERMIYQEPLNYMIKKSNKNYKTNINKHTQDMLIFSQKFANGFSIDEEQEGDFQKHIIEQKKNLDYIKEEFNKTALECKNRIKDYNKHRKKDSRFSIIRFLNSLAQSATGFTYNLKRLPLKDYELLVLVIDEYFKQLETGKTIWQRNDLFDIFNLAYVRRGDKYWTNDEKWVKIIKDVGCEGYLYKAKI